MRRAVRAREILSCFIAALALASCGDDGTERVERLRSPDEPVRYAAVAALGGEGATSTPEVARALRARLDDPSERVRVATAHALARLEGRRAVADLARLAGDESSGVRRVAVEELVALGGDGAVLPLLSLLDDREPEIRAAARRGLVELGVPGAAQVSRAAAIRRDAVIGSAASGSWSRRLEAARELAEFGDEASLGALETLTRDREIEVATEAARGLGRALREGGWPRALRVFGATRPVREALLEGLASARPTPPVGAGAELLCDQLVDPGSARLAARAVARHGISCNLEQIERDLASADRDVRVRAAVVVGALATARPLEAPLRAQAAEVLWADADADDLATVVTLGTPPPGAAERVCREIARYVERSRQWVPVPDGGHPSEAGVIPESSAALTAAEDAEPERVAALQQLLARFPPRGSGWIEIFPSASDPDGLATVLLVASEAGVRFDATELRDLAGSAPDPQVRAGAVWALGGGLDGLQAESAQIRAVAAEALRRRAAQLDGPTKARLAFILAEPDPAVRAAAAATLAATHDPAAVRPLLAAFSRWREPEVAAALGELGVPDAAEPVARALASASASTRPELIEALLGSLARLDARGHDDVVASFLGHPDPRVRRAAALAASDLGGVELRRLAEERRGDLSLAVRDAVSLTAR